MCVALSQQKSLDQARTDILRLLWKRLDLDALFMTSHKNLAIFRIVSGQGHLPKHGNSALQAWVGRPGHMHKTGNSLAPSSRELASKVGVGSQPSRVSIDQMNENPTCVSSTPQERLWLQDFEPKL